MKIKNLLLIMFVVLGAISVAAYTYSKAIQVTDDISLEDIKDCKTVYWDETQDIYGTCTHKYTEIVCDDPPLNTSCHEEERIYEYSCKTGTKKVQKSKEVCRDKEIQLTIDELTKTETYKLEYGEWGKCSYETEGQTLIITCDSKYDGDNNGICKPGESCIQFRVTKDGIQRFEKNSRYDWVEDDDTFFLDRLNVEVVK